MEKNKEEMGVCGVLVRSNNYAVMVDARKDVLKSTERDGLLMLLAVFLKMLDQ